MKNSKYLLSRSPMVTALAVGPSQKLPKLQTTTSCNPGTILFSLPLDSSSSDFLHAKVVGQ